ncbi:hypothetical protein IFR04_002970 [Cadophora malorum]|uniref:Dienelactone hydrolase domain-containing protein n=1 Tax=Cadophora malorum TaxID=108018 RepID=A0A8H7WFD9_9HELO|nr:hypothetical protein IFR04_002970 [Cadophora malorum]
MESINGHSKACCNIPPVVSKGYELKGKYETIGGLKTYVTGPLTATNAIFVIYDIFGYYEQTLQGADILATADPENSYQVFMPDFFEGVPADLAWYPPTTEEKKTALYGWFSTRGPALGVEKAPKILADIEAAYGKKTWAALGFCWGGKVISLTSGASTPWTVAAQCHPAFISAEDAAKITIPMCMLASNEEEAKDVKAFDEALTVEKHIETFETQIHGWLSARADLEDEAVRKEYLRGYETLSKWFGKHIGAEKANL